MSEASLFAGELLDGRAPPAAAQQRLSILTEQQRLEVADYLWLDGLLSSACSDTTTLDARTARALAAMRQAAADADGDNVATLPLRAAWWLRDKVHNTITVSMILSGLFVTTILLSLALWVAPDWRSAAPLEDGPSIEFVARISKTSTATFDKSSDGNLKNRDLFDDDTIVLDSGLVVIEYETGARVVLEGPATYHVNGRNGGDLRGGKLVARVDTEQSRGFTVLIPGASIVDLGTEFGVVVSPEVGTEVAVLTGEVELVGKAGSNQRLKLTKGEGASVEPAGGEITRLGPSIAGSFSLLRREFQFRPSELSAFEGLIYVDFAHRDGNAYTMGSHVVNVRNGNGTTSNLSETTGAVTAIDVTLSGANLGPDSGLMPKPDTDGANLFQGFVNAVGVAPQTGGTTTVKIRGLDPGRRYDVALLSNRIDDSEVTQDEVFEIHDVDAANNISSVATTPTTSAFDTRANTRNGFVARWNRINPGPDGDIVITLTAKSGTVAYLNAMRLAVDVDALKGDEP